MVTAQEKERAGEAGSVSLRWHMLGAAVAFTAGVAPSPSQSQDKSDLPAQFDRNLLRLAPARDGAQSCFMRRYDAKHLNMHPAQKVKAIAIRFEVEHLDDAPAQYRYTFSLGADVQGYGRGSVGGECGYAHRKDDARQEDHGQLIGCGVECDGGGIVVEPAPDGNSLTGRFDRHLRLEAECGGGDPNAATFDLVGEPDDEFVLEKAEVSACSALTDRRQ